MTGIIITGHGNFPSGVLSAVELVAGKPAQVTGVDFKAGETADELKEALRSAAEALEGNEVLILADLVGGTPFNMAAEVKQEMKDKQIRLLAGTNMPAVVEAVFSRMNVGLDELAGMAAEAGMNGVVDVEVLGAQGEEEIVEEGI